MINIKRIETTQNCEYGKVQSLLESSFPIEERRDRNEQREQTNTNSCFFCNIITHNNEFIGIINYWNLNSCYYIEHFALEEHIRNKGFGSETISLIKRVLNDKPIILEVELPEEELSIKRISFYEKNDFKLLKNKYMQPPYRERGKEIELKLMCYTNIDTNCFSIREIIEEIKEEVYSINKK